MAKTTKAKDQELEFQEDLDDLDDEDCFDPEDYIFVVTPRGDVKSVIFPDDACCEYSKKLLSVFKALGVDNPDSLLEKRTLH